MLKHIYQACSAFMVRLLRRSAKDDADDVMIGKEIVLGTLLDRSGWAYDVIGIAYPYSYDIRVYSPERSSASVTLLWDNDEDLLVVDFQVDEPYRGRGLGHALVPFIEGVARHQQLKRICGFVSRRNYEQQPWLLDWYERQGFTVVGVPPNVDAVAHVWRIVEPQKHHEER